MEDQTFRSRLVELLSKSRKANRLYGGVSRSSRGSEFAESQASEWQTVNNDLTNQLSGVLDKDNSKTLPSDVLNILNTFSSQTETTDAEISSKKARLIAIAEAGDFVQSSILSRELVTLRARSQALQAACSEIKSILKRNKTSAPSPDALTAETASQEKPQAKIIQFRQRQVG
jgi:hypothetical protein